MIRKHERRGRNDQTYAFVSFSDPTGMFEVMLFPEVLQASRTLLEAGKSVLVTASAEWDGDELKLRAASIADLENAAAQAGEGMRIYIENDTALGPIASQLKQPGKGIVTLVVPGAKGEEVEISLPKRHLVSAALRNAIKMMPGVANVEGGVKNAMRHFLYAAVSLDSQPNRHGQCPKWRRPSKAFCFDGWPGQGLEAKTGGIRSNVGKSRSRKRQKSQFKNAILFRSDRRSLNHVRRWPRHSSAR